MKKTTLLYNSLFMLLIYIMLLIFLAGCGGGISSKPIINSFSVKPSSIIIGGSSTLSWSVSGATSVSIDQGIGSVDKSSGTHSVSPTKTTVYTLTAANSAGDVTKTATVAVTIFSPVNGSIDVKSTPAGAKIFLDGVDTGQVTPNILTDVKAGNYALRLEKDLYKPKQQTVSINAGKTTGVNWKLEQYPTTTKVLQPTSKKGKDCYAHSGFPDSASYYEDELIIGSSMYYVVRSYIQFDFSSIPNNAYVISAMLSLYQTKLDGFGNFSIGAYQVIDNWEEHTLTWKKQPKSLGQAEDTVTGFAQSNAWKSWLIRDLVQGWLEGSILNCGVALKLDEGVTNDLGKAHFYSSDYVDDTSKCPKLMIRYYIPENN